MGDHHTSVQKYSLSEHAQLRRSLHHEVLLEHQRQGQIFLPENFTSQPESAASEWAVDDYYFLQPVPARQRRAMLREAGVIRIDPVEREECRSLRVSRGRCGCSCREICRPPSCACYRSGIGCQVDQMAFPCPCSRSGCANPYGRVEFNAARVRAHFIRTLLQLGLEQNPSTDYDGGLSPPAKRCRLVDDHLPTSFASLSSSSSSLVNSTCTVVASVSASNGFESPPVYFQSPAELPGPETTVVAYDENYDSEMGDESSSETLSDSCGASFDDGVVADTAGTPHDARQRTLDNYVIRFSRQHTYVGPAAVSVCGVGGFSGGSFHPAMAPHSSLNTPLSCHTMTGLNSSEPFHPLMGLRTETTHASCLSDNAAHACCLPCDDTSATPSGNYSESLATIPDPTQTYCTTNCNQMETTHAGCLSNNAPHAYCLPSKDTPCQAVSLGDYSESLATTAGPTGSYCTTNFDQTETTHASCVLDNAPHAYCLSSDDVPCQAMSSGDYSVSLAARAGPAQTYRTTNCDQLVSGDHIASCEPYFTQQQTTSISSAHHTAADGCTVTYSSHTLLTQQGNCSTPCDTNMPEDTVPADYTSGYCVPKSTTPSCHISDNTLRQQNAIDVFSATHPTTSTTCSKPCGTNSGYAMPEATVPVNNTSGYCVPKTTTPSCHKILRRQNATEADYATCDYSEADNFCTVDDTSFGNSASPILDGKSPGNSSAHDLFIPSDRVVISSDGPHAGFSLDDVPSDKTDVCPLIDSNTPDHRNTDRTVRDHSAPGDNIHIPSSCFYSEKNNIVDKTHSHHPSYYQSHTDTIVRSGSTTENSSGDGSVQDNTLRDHSTPEDNTHVSCDPSYQYHSDTDSIVRSCSFTENSAGDGLVQGSNVDGRSVPFGQRHGNSSPVPNNTMSRCSIRQNITPTSVTDQKITPNSVSDQKNFTSCTSNNSVPDNTMSSNSSTQQNNLTPTSVADQNISASDVTCLKCDDIAVMAALMPRLPEQSDANCVADSDNRVSCPLSVAAQNITSSTVTGLKCDNIEVMAAMMPSHHVENGYHAETDDNCVDNCDNQISCPLSVADQNITLSTVAGLKCDDVEVMAAVMLSNHVENDDNCIADSDSQVSCPLTDTCSKERLASNEASVSKASKTQNDIAPVTEHTSMLDTVPRVSLCPLSDTCCEERIARNESSVSDVSKTSVTVSEHTSMSDTIIWFSCPLSDTCGEEGIAGNEASVYEVSKTPAPVTEHSSVLDTVTRSSCLLSDMCSVERIASDQASVSEETPVTVTEHTSMSDTVTRSSCPLSDVCSEERIAIDEASVSEETSVTVTEHNSLPDTISQSSCLLSDMCGEEGIASNESSVSEVSKTPVTVTEHASLSATITRSSYPLSDMCGAETIAGDEALVSEETSVTVTEHTSLSDTITRSGVVSQSSSVLTVSCVFSSSLYDYGH